MIKQTIFDAYTKISPSETSNIINFLHDNIQERRIPDKTEIRKAVEYAVKECPSFGGFVLTMHDDEALVGVVVINKTGMEGFNPKNILVYYAASIAYRHNGVGSQLLQNAIDHVDGDIALHISSSSPTRALFEKLGFREQCLEMRLSKNKTQSRVIPYDPKKRKAL